MKGELDWIIFIDKWVCSGHPIKPYYTVYIDIFLSMSIKDPINMCHPEWAPLLCVQASEQLVLRIKLMEININLLSRYLLVATWSNLISYHMVLVCWTLWSQLIKDSWKEKRKNAQEVPVEKRDFIVQGFEKEFVIFIYIIWETMFLVVFWFEICR